jgi:DNA-directed RNA polymerase subunit omega
MHDSFPLVRNLWPISGSNPQSPGQVFHPIMQSLLIDEASKVIKNPQILINVISRRVRQLTLGHRALVETKPGTGFSDIALTEVIEGKITFEATAEFKAEPRVGQVTNMGFFNKKRAA